MYCAELSEEWESLRLEVTEANAPRDPACRVKRWWLRADISGNYIRRMRAGDAPTLTGYAQEAKRHRSPEEAESALAAARDEGGMYLNGYTTVERQVWLAYPPKEAD